MGAAAELLAEAVVDVRLRVADFDDADVGVVTLAEDRHRAGLERVLVGHFAGGDGDVVADAGLDEPLDLAELAGFGRVRLGVVEAEVIGRHERAGLADVVAEHLAQGRVEQVRRRVVARRVLPPRAVDLCFDLLTDLDIARGDATHMRNHVTKRLGVSHLHLRDGGAKKAHIADLAAPFGVERRLIKHDHHFFAR